MKAKKEIHLSVDDVHTRLDAIMKSVHDLSTLHESLGRVLGRELPKQTFADLPADLVPNTKIDDAQFLKRISTACSETNLLARLYRLRNIAKTYASAAVDAVRKYDKLNERLALQTDDTPERKSILAKRPVVANAVRVYSYRAKLAAERWAQTRRAALNAILGMTENMYAAIDRVSMGDALRKYPVSQIFESILAADSGEKQKGN